MTLTIQEIQSEVRYIRDSLCPLVNESGGTAITKDILCGLLAFFKELETMPISVDLLRQTHLDKALIEICVLGTRWPANLVVRAEEMLREWEQQVGHCIGQLRAALWEPGGRMAGCRKGIVMEQTMVFDRKRRTWKTVRTPKKGWIVDVVKLAKGNHYGDVGIEPGSWWIKPACAYRDGMLDDPNSGIGVGDYGACAIVLARGSETENMDGTTTWTCTKAGVKSDPKGPGVLSLMKNMRERTEVRMLRSWKLKSKLAPRGGVRYDGLYSVAGHGLKRVGETLYYTFRLKRQEDQAGIERALTHPTADEYDDWVDFRKIQEEKKAVEKATVDRLTILQAIKEMDGTFEVYDVEDEGHSPHDDRHCTYHPQANHIHHRDYWVTRWMGLNSNSDESGVSPTGTKRESNDEAETRSHSDAVSFETGERSVERKPDDDDNNGSRATGNQKEEQTEANGSREAYQGGEVMEFVDELRLEELEDLAREADSWNEAPPAYHLLDQNHS
ncbi:MAG: hypothetical protein M1816_005980 [Peltula sp. TS41687]|nr:MAG: hypothetical protein M1816_005980 [Peltula sp. TS41687]